VRVEVVTIGTELLLGFTLDTNGADLGRALAAAGADVARRTSVPDDEASVRAAVGEALARTGFVITTGGLGPTPDDLTKQAIAALLGRRLVPDQGVLHALEERFRRHGRWPMPAANRRQADVPEGATVLPNPRGTAPGLWLEDAQGRTVVMLPGVPRELRGLLADEVLPRVAARSAGQVVLSRTLRTTGAPESAVAERVAPVEDELPPLSLAFLPSTDGVDLRLTARGLDRAEADAHLTRAATRLRERLGDHYYGMDGSDLAAVVLDAVRAHGRRLAVAESCTGGLLGARLTAVPGASAAFVGAVVAYADDVKRDQLGVPAETLARHGAVSEETVRAMAEGARRAFGADCVIAITGIAGPTGGTPDKPVGTVCLAAGRSADVRVATRVFPGDRTEIRQHGAQAGLDLLRRLLIA